MNPQELVDGLRARGVWIWTDGDRLRFSAPASVPEAEVLGALRQHKQTILDYLTGPAQASFAQQRLWILDQLSPGGAAYNTAGALELGGALDVEALEEALRKLMLRHEGLRTVFVNRDGEPHQLALTPQAWTLPQTDLSPWSDAGQQLVDSLRRETSRGFDLAQGPLFRAHLYRLTAERHVLLLVMHHIVSDGWSMGVLYRDLAAFYGQLVRGEDPALPPLRLQYRDYARWQRGRLSGEVLESQLVHWRARLAGAPTVLELPSDRSRPAVVSHRGAFEPFEFPPALTDRLQQLSRREGVTLFMTLLAGFAALLGRYSGEEDLLIGTPVANRQRAETESVVGLFVNTLVLRAHLTGSPSVTEFLARVRDVCLDAFTHQELPFERLVEDLHPARDLSRNPLFQVMFALENTPHLPPEFAGLTSRAFGFDSGAAQFDLALYVREEAGGGLSGSFNYATDLFDRPTVTRLVTHWQTLLEAMVATPEAPVVSLAMVPAAERRQVVEGWNATARAYGGEARLHRLIEAQAARTPAAVALVGDGQTLSLAAVNARANQLARVLRAKGVGPDGLVGVCAERSVELVVALLAVLKAGGAYVPLDPSYPAERLGHMLEDAQARLVLVQPHLAGGLPAGAAELLLLDPAGAASAHQAATDLDAEGTPDDLAYVIFTSGSTGRPKGAMNAHRGIVNRLVWMQEAYGLTAADRVLQKTPYSFDVSVWEFFWPLLTGTPLVLARPEGHKDPRYLVELIQAAGITTLHFVPSMLRVFLEEPGVEACTSLVRIICSGEALPYELQERVFARLPQVALHNLYGPTECAVDVTSWACRRDDQRRVVPIGRPVANTQMYVLDPALRPVPMGVAGELYIGGVQVGRGYVGRPDLTAERFVPDPFAATPGARLYRTGDRARWLADGAIEYLGRLDFQVKIRGQRIELGEIEAVLAQHAAVGQSVVLAREDGPGDQRLVAYVVPQGPPPDAADLKAWLARQLPPYMVPGVVVFLAALPLTASGKVARTALPAPQPAPGATSVAPRTPTEEILAGIWAEVLGVPRVGVDDDFFDLGGHSLLATQVASRVRHAFAVELPLRAFFEAPTIAGLGSRVEAQRTAAASTTVAPSIASGIPGPAPLSFAQQRLWMLDQIAPGTAAYTITSALELQGPLNVAALKQSLDALVARHESLRTVFVSVAEEPVQIVTAFEPLTLQLRDASPAADPRSRIEAWLHDDAARPFDLARGPLFRAHLYRQSAEIHVLLLAMHHIIADGWSLAVLFRDLTTLYQSFAAGDAPALPEQPVTYRDYARWQRGWLRDDVVVPQIAHWKTRLAGAPLVLELPTDRPRPPVESRRGALYTFTVPRALLDRLQALSRREGTTLFMTLLSGFALLLGRYAGQTDVIVGAPVANRPRAELEGLIGCFVNTLALRVDLTGAPTVRALLHRVREVCLDAFAHQDVPFEHVVEALHPVRDLSRNAVVQVMFALQNVPTSAVDLAGLRLAPVRSDTASAQFDLSLLTWETADGLDAAFSYATDLFDEATVARLGAHWTALLEAMTSQPDRAATGLPMLGDAERQLVIDSWNRTRVEFSPAKCVHELVHEQTRVRPDALAVEHAGRSLSYRELDAAADSLAQRLRALDVRVDTRVAVYLERSLETPIALLAVLKCGAAYVPIDPGYPTARVRFMLEDSQSVAVVTQRSLGAALTDIGAAVVLVDANEGSDVPSARQVDPTLVSPSELAYLIYTSGSTGQPKGVPITHANLYNLIRWHQHAYAVTPADRATQLAGPAFDAMVWELWPYLTAGASVHVPDEDTRLDPAALVRFLVAQRITLTFLPTPVAEAALREPWPADTRLRVLLTGGDRLTQRPPAGLPFRLVNHYGPTENTVVSTCADVEATGASAPLIGRPLPNTRVYVVDPQLQPVPLGVPGELLVGGGQLAAGYWRRPELTAEKFLSDSFDATPGARVYRTGDRVRYRPDGQLEFLGRLDQQVKIRGFRIELGEVEACLAAHPTVREIAVVPRQDAPGDTRLIAYVVAPDPPIDLAERLRTHARTMLPEYMVPAAVVRLDALPLTPNGKIDRSALPAPPDRGLEPATIVGPRSGLEQRIAAIWRDVLGLEQVGVTDNFFDLGGHSLLLVKAHARLRVELAPELRVVDLFAHPTIAAMATHLSRPEGDEPIEAATGRVAGQPSDSANAESIAIIGMAGRFPGAAGIEELWANLRVAAESLSFFTVEELRDAGVPESMLGDPSYVRAGGVLDGADRFDAAYFGYSAREAELLNPQQRVLLECAAETLDRAGYDPDRYRGLIGVYAGSSASSYGAGSEHARTDDELTALLGQSSDFLTTRVSYELNLRGPSVNVQTACSTSLVAVHEACVALRTHECDMALAGGVSVTTPLKSGYLYVPNGIGSSDGRCRAFDVAADGTVHGNGVAMVLLKRLADALNDGDHIHAVIRGTAINNDGSDKVGFTAPSVEGQARAIARAHAAAGVTADTIDYVEAHGTATQLGDPIEVAALNRVFGRRGERSSPCWLGSIKTNLGHLDAAAGVTGLIKAALSLEHRELVPSLHFTHPNPGIDFAAGPLQVSTELRPWQAPAHRPRRAGVSSFGLGGTNAHAVLEEAALPEPSAPPAHRWQTLCLSAKTPAALAAARANLAAFLRERPAIDLADAAYTLQVGRREFPHRAVVVCRDVDEAVTTLDAPPPTSRPIAAGGDARPVVFMFSGQGAQYAGMARGLYEHEPEVRTVVDRCAETLAPVLGLDLRDVLFPVDGLQERAAAALTQTALTQPALFVIEYAVARLWLSRGLEPAAMIGHSIGEYVAACLAGVMAEDDALRLVAARGRLMQQAPQGVMLAVPFGEDEARRLAAGRVDVAAVNGLNATVLSGTDDAINSLERDLTARGAVGTRLRTSHAFHSRMMEPVLDEFAKAVAAVTLQPPSRPLVSNVTGTWMTAADATDPGYWLRHLRDTVRFAHGIDTLMELDGAVFLEIGPGGTLAGFARKQAVARSAAVTAVQSLPSVDRRDDAERQMASAAGALWAAGVAIDWLAYHGDQPRRRIVLPPYPFQRERYWLSAPPPHAAATQASRRRDPAEWVYVPSWRRSALPAGTDHAGGEWLVFLDRLGLGAQLAAELLHRGADVTTVEAADRFAASEPGRFSMSPASRQDYGRLIAALVAAGRTPRFIAHLWSVDADGELRDEADFLADAETRGFFSVAHLVGALHDAGLTTPVGLALVASHTHDVTGAERLCPEKALILGPAKTIAGEYPTMVARTIDVAADADRSWLASALASDLVAGWTDPVVAYRGRYRWVQAFEPLRLAVPSGLPSRLRPKGVYIVTGGLGRVGLEVAAYLAREARARIALISRTGLPERTQWDRWIAEQGPDEPSSLRMRRVQQMEAAGAEVIVCRADVADEAQMATALAEVEARFGRIHGVMHLAGDHRGQARIGELRSDDVAATFRPKLGGLRVLERVLRNRPLDCCVIHSSLASFMGRLELTAYTAASAYTDAFVHRHNRSSATPWQTINWDAWRTEATSPDHALVTPFSMTPHEATAVLGRLLNVTDVPQALVSTADPQARITQWVRLERAPTQRLDQEADQRAYPRPELSSEYEAPRTDAERVLATVWHELFGVDRVGIHDNFFELGGDSVLNLQMSAKASQAGLTIPPRLVFEHQTIAELAAAIAPMADGTADVAVPAAERTASVLQPTVASSISESDLSEILRQVGGGEPGR